MRILILTSKDHIYANYLLRHILRMPEMRQNSIMIWEQNSIVPGKSRMQGLMRYIRLAGLGYVCAQALKQMIFLMIRTKATLTHQTSSTFYPYWLPKRKSIAREAYGGIKTDEATRRVKKFNPSLILSVFSKEIIPDRILEIPKYGAVNIHPAPLPEFKGVSPIFWAMAKGRNQVGVTLHYIDSGIDTGAIISQEIFAMHPGESEHHVYLKLTRAGVGLMREYLLKLFHNRNYRPKTKKYEGTGSYYSLPTKAAMTDLYRNGYVIFRVAEFL